MARREQFTAQEKLAPATIGQAIPRRPSAIPLTAAKARASPMTLNSSVMPPPELTVGRQSPRARTTAVATPDSNRE